MFANIFYTKTCPIQTFEKCIMSSIFFVFKTFPRWCLLVQNNEKWVCETKSMNKICSKSKTKPLEQHKRCCSVVFIFNFRGVDIEDSVKHLRRSFLHNSRDKSWYFELGSKYINTIWLTDFDLTGLLEDFISVPQNVLPPLCRGWEGLKNFQCWQKGRDLQFLNF